MSVLKGFFILIVLLLGLFFGALAIGSGGIFTFLLRDLSEANFRKIEADCKKQVLEDPECWSETMRAGLRGTYVSFIVLIVTLPVSVLLLGSGVYLVKRTRRMNRELRDGKIRHPLD